MDSLVKIFTSWPVPLSIAIIFIGIAFVYFNREATSEFIRKKLILRNKKAGLDTLEKNQRKEPADDSKRYKKLLKEYGVDSPDKLKDYINNLNFSLSSLSEKEKQNKKIFDELFKLVMHYRFSYLNCFLVLNSKLALKYFRDNGPCAKDLFKLNFNFIIVVDNQEAQKEIIFNILVNEDLIELNQQGFYKISTDGASFLKYIGL